MRLIKTTYENGLLRSEGYLNDSDREEGEWIFYYERGGMHKTISYKDGVESGQWTLYYENGNIHIQQYKQGGKSFGPWREFYENGNPKEVGEYSKDGYRPLEFWDENKNQLMKNGTGKKIEKFGFSESDIFEQYYENGVFIKENKLSTTIFRDFIPNDDN